MKELQMTKWLAHVSEASCRTACYWYIGATLDNSTTVNHLDLVVGVPWDLASSDRSGTDPASIWET